MLKISSYTKLFTPSEDEKRLSPLLHGHVNVLGHYSFTLAEQIMMGQLRPLNQYSENIIILP